MTPPHPGSRDVGPATDAGLAEASVSRHGRREPRDPASALTTLAGLALVWTVAWSTPAGQIGEDTKNDLYVDAWGLMRRALHLWDPQVTWGMLQNQGYGYLFPMAPFYAVLSEVLPVWVVQRLWWTALLTIGYLAMLALLRSLTDGRLGAVHVGALAYTLAPRVLSTLGAISPEAQTQLLAPAILLPLVLAGRGRLGPRRAVALSAVAILLCGGVNATATLLACVPAGLWLITERRWWSHALTWWWAGAVIASTAWWLGPLLLLGRYSPPFLTWIENANAVVQTVGLLDVVKGTTHWLGHLLVPGGPWWPAGWALTDSPSVVVATTILGGLGLAGLAMPIRRRGFLLATLCAGVLLIALGHEGPLASPIAGAVRDAFDGPLAPFRNVHKADPLVRLPLTIGLVNALRHLARAVAHLTSPRAEAAGARRVVPALAAGLVVIGAAPALGGTVATRGTFTGMPTYWRDAGEWLDRHTANGGAVLLPSASFGEYTWGRTIDEPLRSLTTAPYAVRDAVPLTPAGTIRFLDEITRRAQSGRDLRGVGRALLAAGVKYVVLRNDLATDLTGGPPVAVTRSALLDSPGISRVAGFGKPQRDVTGTPVSPVEIFAITGTASPRLTLWPGASIPVVAGASEALPALQESALAGGPVLFDGDATPRDGTARVETDTFAARDRYFGTTRGQDVTRMLTRAEAEGAADYFPWPAPGLRTTVTYGGGLASLTASSALSDRLTFAGLVPARRPYAALDGDSATAWLTLGDPAPTWTATFAADRRIDAIEIRPAADRRRFGSVAAATRVRVSFGGQSIDVDLAVHGSRIALPANHGRELTITIVRTSSGDPGLALTGLAEIAVPGLDAREIVDAPAPATSGPTGGFVLSRDPEAFDGCIRSAAGYQCLEGSGWPAEETGELRRSVSTTAASTYAMSGTLVADPAHPSPLLALPGIASITASSTRAAGQVGAPRAVLDADPGTAWSPAIGDRDPTLTIRFTAPQLVAGLRVHARADWLAENAPMTVAVTRDGRRTVAVLGIDGRIALPAMATTALVLQFIPDAGTDHITALELAGVDVAGFAPSPPGPSVGVACGGGPKLLVGGTTIPTAVIGERAAVAGAGTLVWQACASAPVPKGTTEVSVGRWRDLVPAQLVARADAGPVAGSTAAAGTAPEVVAAADGGLTARVESAAYDRFVVLTQNANPGWRARAGGTALVPRTVDGYRQAFVLPAGAGGEVVIDFAPDRPYRRALGAGGVLGLGVLVAATWPGRRRVVPVDEGGPGQPTRRGVRALGVLALGALLAGMPGAVLAGLVLIASGRGRRPGDAAADHDRAPQERPTTRAVVAALGGAATRQPAPVVVVILLTLAGAVQAGFADGTGPGAAWVEATTRTLSLVALLIVVAAAPPAPPPLGTGGAGTPSGSPEPRSRRS
ncbi:alpha-(1-_3)-arabinofuranosyltransferase domain-containing protein [Nostocoides vanveenii]|uniref:Alpha-(1->3)-arabinofuranosyltransferase n=1 Tax=Nostocoides vanveenii TaxID=330835 RepID=A0ABP4WQ70_9MICO